MIEGMQGSLRTTWRTNDQAMTEATFNELLALLEELHPGKVRRVIEVCPVAVVKTIDNEADARQTITNIKNRKTKNA